MLGYWQESWPHVKLRPTEVFGLLDSIYEYFSLPWVFILACCTSTKCPPIAFNNSINYKICWQRRQLSYSDLMSQGDSCCPALGSTATVLSRLSLLSPTMCTKSICFRAEQDVMELDQYSLSVRVYHWSRGIQIGGGYTEYVETLGTITVWVYQFCLAGVM